MKKLEFWLGIFSVIGLIFSIMLCLGIFWPTSNMKLLKIFTVIAFFIAATYFFIAPSRRERKKAQEIKNALNDPLWDLKKKILKVFLNGPMSFGFLIVRVDIDYSCKEIAKALKEMEAKGVVQKRKPIEDSPDFQMWGITLPDFSKLWVNLRKFFSKRRKK